MKKYGAFINNQFLIPAQIGMREISLRHPIQAVKKTYKHFAQDSLYRNSFYLMLSTAIMAFFGFFFWIIVTRLYTAEQVGIATTLISVTNLISVISTLGLSAGLIRFIPKSEHKNNMINSSFTITIVSSLLISLLFLIGIKILSPKLIFLRENTFFTVTFMLFITISSVNLIVDSIFIAYRSAKYALIKSSVISIVKLILPVFLITFNAYGIILAVAVGNVLAFFVSLMLLVVIFKYSILLRIHIKVVNKLASYSFGNFIAGLLTMLPTMTLPIIITNKIGSEETAYYSIAMMIGALFFIIPMSTAQSLFAEGSHNEEDMKNHIIKAVKITALFLLPVIIITILFGNYILLAFGRKYSSGAFTLLQFLVLSTVFISVSSISATILRVREKIKELIGISAFSALVIILLSYVFIELKLIGIGYAWLIGQAAIAIVYLYFVVRDLNKHSL